MLYNIAKALSSAARTTTTTYDPTVQFGGGISQPIDVDGLTAYLNVTVVPGVDTVLLKLQEQIPATGTWVDVPGAATLAQVATGLIKLIVGPGIATVAPSVSLDVLASYLPPAWRLQIVHSGAGSFTYSLDVCLQKTS